MLILNTATKLKASIYFKKNELFLLNRLYYSVDIDVNNLVQAAIVRYIYSLLHC